MIPITFNKDDLNNVKKGNVRGQDLASFLSISMPKRAGVLDIFDDPCGYVQIVPTTGYATVTMKKGYINIYGRCIYVEQGEQVQIALPSSGSVTGTFGIRVDLGETGANEVAWFTKTTTLQQDNILNNEITGIYEFALYNYTATTTDLTLTKVATIIENIDDYMKGANFETQEVTDNSTKLATTAFVKNVVNNQFGISYVSGTSGGKNFGVHYMSIGPLMVIYGKLTRPVQKQVYTIPFGRTLLKNTAFASVVVSLYDYNSSLGYPTNSAMATNLNGDSVSLIKLDAKEYTDINFVIVGEKA